MDIKKLNDKQKKALTIGGVVAAAAVFLGFRAMNQGTPADPKLKILGIDNAGSVHFTINGTKHISKRSSVANINLSDRYKLVVVNEYNQDGSILKRFLHTQNPESWKIISELGQVYV